MLKFYLVHNLEHFKTVRFTLHFPVDFLSMFSPRIEA